MAIAPEIPTPYGQRACPRSLSLLLAPYFEAKTLWIERDAIVGTAADGVVVEIGRLGQWSLIESYLRAHPAPSDW